MYRTILVPLDGSELAERALPEAEALARACGSKLVLLHVASPPSGEAIGLIYEHARRAREAASYLAGIAARMGERARVETAVVYGEPASAIVEESLLRAADLVVMATHGRSGLGRLIYGSVAEGVLARSPVPVLLVRSTPARRALEAPRVLVPLDGSAFAEQALRVAAEVAGAFGAELWLLVAVPEPTSVRTDEHGRVVAYLDEELELRRSQAWDYLRRARERLAATRALQARLEVRVGPPAETIAAASAEHEVSLVVMATHARGGLGRLVAGSVAGELLARGEVPLLLLPPGAQRKAA